MTQKNTVALHTVVTIYYIVYNPLSRGYAGASAGHTSLSEGRGSIGLRGVNCGSGAVTTPAVPKVFWANFELRKTTFDVVGGACPH